MAVEFSGKVISVFGDRRVCFGTMIVTGVTSGAVETGLRRIESLQITPTTWTTSSAYSFKFEKNVNSAGSASNGFIYVGNATAGDQFNMLAIGD